MSSIAQNSDYVPPGTKRASESRVVKAGNEAPAPIKSRVPLGFLTVNGHKEPVFEPISGYEHLFYEDVTPPHPTPIPPEYRKVAQDPSHSKPFVYGGFYANEEDANISTTFSIGDVDSLKRFYKARFQELTMKPMRDIVAAWVKRLEPERRKKYGAYQRYSNQPKSLKTLWWPVNVPYIEPSHLKLHHLVPLAVDIMLIHRRIDEEVGKHKHTSWTRLLETDAVYLISSKDEERFSSSRGAKFNIAMKKRALEAILPSIFNIAKSHEEYVAQYNLYEGSGNEDPGCGEQVTWQAIPKPDYQLRCNFQAKTKADQEAARPISLSPPFNSTSKYTEDVGMFRSPVPDEPPPTSEVAATQPLYQPPTPTSDTPVALAVDRHSMDCLYEGDSKPHLAFGISQPLKSVAPRRSTDLLYKTTQSYYAPNDFATCGLVVPHNVALGGALEPYLPNSSDMHGLPNSSDMRGLPNSSDMRGLPNSSHMCGLPNSSHMHSLSDGSQMYSVPNSGQMYGLHQGFAHNFFTHGMPMVADWSNPDVLH
ncbi:hypothetical protein PMIN01_13419 [Paraphaeosphaeria minitans]|uniref:Subtelomeric hrmA-associated cluster protein AFUB-079030/YDR124W-like helical bundle domain-containing protein n=1 Tax=Paraphaeosphaeria minitans TaxID=565426 RepID=A0A9P6KJI6_9PLEO|nr:hypothetical protein PMIN01_13419 [Paraphaeosphaeria minitans]